MRRKLPGASEKDASLRHRAIASSARFRFSPLFIVRLCISEVVAMVRKAQLLSSLADKLCGHPTNQHERNQDLPGISVAVSRYREVIADHDKDNGNGHESIVFGT